MIPDEVAIGKRVKKRIPKKYLWDNDWDGEFRDVDKNQSTEQLQKEKTQY